MGTSKSSGQRPRCSCKVEEHTDRGAREKTMRIEDSRRIVHRNLPLHNCSLFQFCLSAFLFISSFSLFPFSYITFFLQVRTLSFEAGRLQRDCYHCSNVHL